MDYPRDQQLEYNCHLELLNHKHHQNQRHFQHQLLYHWRIHHIYIDFTKIHKWLFITKKKMPDNEYIPLLFRVPKFNHYIIIGTRIEQVISQMLCWCGSHGNFKGLPKCNHHMESGKTFLTSISKTPSMILWTINQINISIFWQNSHWT